MTTLRGINLWKAAGILLLLAVFIGVMFLGPALRKPPEAEPGVDVPAMSNIPPPGSLHFEQ